MGTKGRQEKCLYLIIKLQFGSDFSSCICKCQVCIVWVHQDRVKFAHVTVNILKISRYLRACNIEYKIIQNLSKYNNRLAKHVN